MLKEDQAAELLKGCEASVGKKLVQIRGNLRRAATRAAALWELIVIDAAAQIGRVDYEPKPNGSPDVLLHLPKVRSIWLEAAFLEPRFWQEERKSTQVASWLSRELRRRGISLGRIHYRFEGDVISEAGPVLRLPDLHERRQFLNEPSLASFLAAIQAVPSEERSYMSPSYSISIHYSPGGEGPYSISSGPALEAPRSVAQHALYRLLMEKTRQHEVVLPLVACIGSIQSPALAFLTAPGQPRARDVINAVFSKSRSLSAVIVVRIDSEKGAQGEIFANPTTRNPLEEQEIKVLCTLDFNRWRYTFPLKKWEQPDSEIWLRRVSGKLVCRLLGGATMEIEIPSSILVDILAGRTSLAKEYRLSEDDPVFRAVNDGWTIEDCRFRAGDLQAGVAPTVILTLTIPPVYALKSSGKAQS